MTVLRVLVVLCCPAVLSLSALACGATPGGERLLIANTTSDTLSVRGRLNERPFAVLRPGEDTAISFPGWMCEERAPGNSLVATAGNGTTYTYGPPLCNGGEWEIGSRP
ncbi:hypothetical protein [Spongiactinospora sp. TRM90649]|uniref:hypothetical protein n=1 Tax=Spongiactinospora sp. TRM90649 TaxID=3031114 RepID=UPI0023F62F7B|nr:hypothetical protein [Spongiactinospora sp. TRM90649]MDF5751064.1 hypothetical protein [Spongiactinospora sp. TRM90649]